MKNKKVWYIYSTYRGVSSTGPFYKSKKKAREQLDKYCIGHLCRWLDNGYKNKCLVVCDDKGEIHYYQILSAELN